MSVAMHFFVIDMTLDNDSWEQVVNTTGSTILLRPSVLPKDACCFIHKESETTKNRSNSYEKTRFFLPFS